MTALVFNKSCSVPLQKHDIKKVAEGWFEFADKHRTEHQLGSFQYVDAERIRTALLEGQAVGEAMKA